MLEYMQSADHSPAAPMPTLAFIGFYIEKCPNLCNL